MVPLLIWMTVTEQEGHRRKVPRLEKWPCSLVFLLSLLLSPPFTLFSSSPQFLSRPEVNMFRAIKVKVNEVNVLRANGVKANEVNMSMANKVNRLMASNTMAKTKKDFVHEIVWFTIVFCWSLFNLSAWLTSKCHQMCTSKVVLPP